MDDRRSPTLDVVVPTIGRPSLRRLIESLLADGASAIGHVYVVDDRRGPADVLALPPSEGPQLTVLRSGGRGPAAARNAGWRASRAEWIAFLDDDVVVPTGWSAQLHDDVMACEADVAATQGRIVVPLPEHRRPTDWERSVAALQGAQWATADMAIRRRALLDVGGFDERFPRAYREDSDLGLRLVGCGHRLTMGRRHVLHPPGPAPWHVSIRRQVGNRDDEWMRRLHGPDWRSRAGAPRGRLRRHRLVTAAGALAAGGALARRRGLASVAAVAWLAGTTELVVRRASPGPRTVRDVGAMALTSIAIPPAATAWALAGHWTSRHQSVAPRRPAIDAVLLDRDGTLIVDVPYNGDPSRVEPMPGAREALDRLRRDGVALAVVTNQSGVAHGRFSTEELGHVNARVEELLGPFDAWAICVHGPDDGCVCRKPSPGLVREAAAALHVDPARCVVIGDIGSDMGAAACAGARGILVPTAATRPEEIVAAPDVARDLGEAVDAILGTA